MIGIKPRIATITFVLSWKREMILHEIVVVCETYFLIKPFPSFLNSHEDFANVRKIFVSTKMHVQLIPLF